MNVTLTYKIFPSFVLFLSWHERINQHW